ncbi:MAG: YfhO family protein [Thermomicrobiales bacterium]
MSQESGVGSREPGGKRPRRRWESPVAAAVPAPGVVSVQSDQSVSESSPSGREGWFTDGRALAVLALLLLLAVSNRLAFDNWLTRLDLFTFFLPWYHFLGEQLRQLAVPGWNPHLFSGAPFAGDPESGWMYFPAMLLFALFSATTAFKSMVAVQVTIAAFSTFALTRVLGMGSLASLIAATVYAVGPFLHWNTYCCLIFGQFATWVPLTLLGIELALRADAWRPRLAAWALGGLAVSQMLGGWAGEGWLYAVLLPAAYAGYRGLLDPPGHVPSPPFPPLPARRERGHRRVRSSTSARSIPSLPFGVVSRLIAASATAMAIPALGLALGAAGILPRLIVNTETNLAGGDYSRLGNAGVLNPPWQLWYLLTQVLGEGTGYHVRAVSPGGAVVILFALALLLTTRRFAVPFFAALTLIAWLLTLETTPLHQVFYLIPRYREFHDHDAWRTVALSAIGPAVLSGAAIESLPKWRGRRYLLPVVVLPLLLLLITAAALSRLDLSLGWPPLLAATVTTVLVAIIVAAPGGPSASGWRPFQDPRPVASSRQSVKAVHSGAILASETLTRTMSVLILAVIFVLPTGLELTGSWLGWPQSAYWEARWHPDPAEKLALETATSTSDPGGAGEFLQSRLAADGPFRYAGYAGFGYGEGQNAGESYMGRRFDPAVEAVLVNGRPIFLGLYDVQGYNPLQLSRYVEFMDALNGGPQDYHTAFLLPAGLTSPLLDLLDVRYLVVDGAIPPDRDDLLPLTAQAREVFRGPLAAVYERTTTPRHAWIVHDIRPVARGEALPLLTSGAVDPFRTALVEGAPPVSEAPPAGADELALVTDYAPDRIEIEANAATPGLLVVSEVYESGWRASVDGVDVPILPTDHALRGVPLPAGTHTVVLHYDPWPLRLGLIASTITAIMMLVAFAAVAFSLRRRSQ